MTEFTRRHTLALMAGTLGSAACAHGNGETASGDSGDVPLKTLAAGKGIRFGTAMDAREIHQPDYVDIVLAECAVIVAENEHKMYTIQPTPEKMDWGPGDALVEFAKTHGLGMRGHTLLWQHPQWLPDWVNDTTFSSAVEAETLLRTYVQAVAARDAGFIYSWDVVNETIDPETGEIRETSLTRAMGPEVLDAAFHAAREAAPGATLAYNDYMSWEPSHEKHRSGVLRMLERLKRNDTPVDALGIQSHSNDAPPSAFTPTQQRIWRDFVDEAVGMGLEIYLTEFDVNDSMMAPGIAERDREIAAFTRDYLDMMFSYPETKDLLVWGLADHHSWLQGFKPREDGLPKRPTLYDSAYRAKPMREAVAAALRAAPVRS
ncbi:MAG: endo-1,4-beta-xylanase [Pseudomonadota bacterium]|nr:endo-1,4-beta-xylanase [Pseudomonadota bacterium]